MTLPNDAIQTLGGFRLVRKLGSGVRSEVYLGVGGGEEVPPRTVALKLFRPGVAREDMARELATLARLDNAHCVRLIDVATGPRGAPVPILQRIQRGSVAQLLGDRESLEPGEAVTLLAPVAGVVAELHARGIAHGRIGARSLHLGAAGEPVLLGFGHARDFAEGLSAAALDELDAAMADRRALVTLSQAVLTRVRRNGSASGPDALLTWLEGAAGSCDVDFTSELVDRLFTLAEPVPIEFARVGAPSARVPARIGSIGGDARSVALPRAAAVLDQRGESGSSVVGHEPTDGLPRWLRDFLLRGPIESARSRILTTVRGVRRPLWIVMGAVLLALLTAMIVVPWSAPATHRGSPTASGSPSAQPSTRPDEASSDGMTSETAGSDDPVTALPKLLKARARCIRELSIGCLTAAEEESSAAVTEDGAVIRRIRSGQQTPASATIMATSPTLIQRLGDSALVALNTKTGPASALLVKGESGWRIRAFLTGRQVQP